jgi:predicted TIM-barrel fold metal-dependent hydrolase
MIAVARKHEKVLVDTSAYTIARLPPQHALEGLEGLGLDEEASALYLRENTGRVFGIDSGG